MSSGFVVCFVVLGCFWSKRARVKWAEPGLVQVVLRL